MNVDSMTMATFIKLFEIKIVANKWLGLCISFFIGATESFSSSASFDESREKKATSDPEIRADDISNNKIPSKANTRFKSMLWLAIDISKVIICSGSSSKRYSF